MGEFFRRFRYLLNRGRFERELESDMAFHREMAAREGRTNFGNMLRLREDARQAWGWMWIDRLGQDLRYAIRILMNSPGFTVTAILVLAIGIGVNMTAFGLFNLIALRPLPVRDPHSLVRLQRRSPENYASEMPYPFVTFFQEHAKTLRSVMAVMGVPPMELNEDTMPVTVTFVTPNYFVELGTSAATGRLLHPQWDDRSPMVVLSYEFWQRRFGGEPTVVGQTIRLNKKPATVIGVMSYAAATLDGQHSDVWLPIGEQPYFVEGSQVLTDPLNGSVRMWGRLAGGVTKDAAAQELLSLTNELRKIYPKAVWDKQYVRIDPGGHLKVMQPEMYQVAGMVEGLALLILTVACSNLGGLMMARGVAREREITIRVAIGASWRRVFRQLFTESLILALLGSGVGMALSWVALEITLNAVDAPGWMSAAPDWRVILAAFAMALAAAGLFGLAPALQVAKQRQRKTLARQVLVGAQLAGSCALLIIAGLLVRAVHHLLFTDPGFGYMQVIGIDPRLESHGYGPAAARNYLNTMRDRVQGMPGVEHVAMSKIPLLTHGLTSSMTVDIAGHPVNIYPNWVDPGFFQTMAIRLLRGRVFSGTATDEVMVSESFASKVWPGQNPIGKPLWRDGSTKETIVGVVGNARVKSMNDGDAVEVYWRAKTEDMPDMTLLVKTAGAMVGAEARIKSISDSVDPKLFPSIWLLKSGFRETALDLERLALAVSVLGLVALAISAIGIVGLMAYTVSQQVKDIAIRLALGARPAQVMAALAGQFWWPLLLGLAVGTGLTMAISALLRKTLYGVDPLDPLSYLGAIAVLLLATAMAAVVPARRVLHLNPATALHHQ